LLQLFAEMFARHIKMQALLQVSLPVPLHSATAAAALGTASTFQCFVKIPQLSGFVQECKLIWCLVH